MMATRKRISVSDVLRQEAQKSPDAEDKPVIDTTAEEVVEQDAPAVEELSTVSPDKSAVKGADTTTAELEATIVELKAALEQASQLELAHQHEGSLQQQVIELQSELTEQKNLVHKLQKDLKQVDKLKADLEQTKKEALQLADANSKLIEEMNALKKETKDIKTSITAITPITPAPITPAPITPIYKPIERKIGKMAPEGTKEPDFAVNTWLL
ncbi:hypothetical protein [Argonema galeatum]|uniref:hypothetical protein n=1 Tax=Argonema galeatum TaxID=2942762 RepID=UPI002010DA4D|nr:hypothetical protein [Argonema galeatum]MCL1462999.1 hypothetical protein [Argonema galeatum A003/A1]